MQTSEQLNLLPMAEQVPLCKQLRFHVWALNQTHHTTSHTQ
jgi:hypothetical protein